MSTYNIPVIDRDDGCKVFHVSPAEARRLIKKRQARWIEGHRKLQLTGLAEAEWCPQRSHTSRSSFMGAIGRSQDYTVREHLKGTGHRVTALKHLQSRDWGVYHMAILDCMTPQSSGLRAVKSIAGSN
jgi:hypothetical protein